MADLDLDIGDKALALASGGSGSTSSISRSSASNLLFGIPLLLISLSLLSLSRRYARLRSSIGLALCAAIATWALTVSRQNGQSFIAGTNNGNTNDIIIWAITAVISILAAILGATFLWPIGILGMAVSAGFAFALEILLLGNNGLIHSSGGRWAWITIWSLASFATIVFIKHKQRHWVELIQSTITGTFIFSLSIDLLANGANGASTGLRYILDTNSYHHAALVYKPKLSTQLLMPLAWLLTPILAYAQYRVFPKAQEWPTKSNWFFEVRDEDEKDEDVDASAVGNGSGSGTSPSSSSYNLDAEKAISDAKHGSVHDTLPSSSEGQKGEKLSSSETTLVAPEQNTFPQSQHRPITSEIRNSSHTLRPNPPRFPRSHSFPSQPSRAGTTARHGSPPSSTYRNSSAYPFPSVFQLMHPYSNTANGNANDNMQLGPPPPNSRHNSRRKSWIPYSTPSSTLNAHQEDDGRISLDQLERGDHDSQRRDSTEAGKAGGASSILPQAAREGAHIDEAESEDADGTHIRSTTLISPTSSTPDSTYTANEQGRASPEMVTAASSLSSYEEQDYTNAEALPSETQALSVPMRETKSSSSSSDALDDDNIPSTAGTSVTSLVALEAQEEKGVSDNSRVMYTAPENMQAKSLYLDAVYRQEGHLHGAIIASISSTAVRVRTTIDNWATFTDTPALAERMKTRRGGQELSVWSFTLQESQVKGPLTVQMAIVGIDETGKEGWDSNEGKNYIFSL